MVFQIRRFSSLGDAIFLHSLPQIVLTDGGMLYHRHHFSYAFGEAAAAPSYHAALLRLSRRMRRLHAPPESPQYADLGLAAAPLCGVPVALVSNAGARSKEAIRRNILPPLHVPTLPKIYTK